MCGEISRASSAATSTRARPRTTSSSSTRPARQSKTSQALPSSMRRRARAAPALRSTLHEGAPSERRTVMVSLLDEAANAVVLTPIAKEGLDSWLESAPAHDREWLRTTGFSAEPGKFAFLPNESGRPLEVVVGADL